MPGIGLTHLVVLQAVLDVLNLLRSLFQSSSLWAVFHEESCGFEI
jgi:hypothetical protein